jgi:hypothetical protein
MKNVSMCWALCMITILIASAPTYASFYSDAWASNEDTYGAGSLSGWGSGTSHTASITINSTYPYSTSCGSGDAYMRTTTAGTFCGEYSLKASASAVVYLGGTSSTTYTVGGANAGGSFSSYGNSLSPDARVQLTGVSTADTDGENPDDIYVSAYAYFSANTGVEVGHETWAAGNISVPNCGASGQAQGYGYATGGMCN